MPFCQLCEGVLRQSVHGYQGVDCPPLQFVGGTNNPMIFDVVPPLPFFEGINNPRKWWSFFLGSFVWGTIHSGDRSADTGTGRLVLEKTLVSGAQVLTWDSWPATLKTLQSKFLFKHVWQFCYTGATCWGHSVPEGWLPLASSCKLEHIWWPTSYLALPKTQKIHQWSSQAKASQGVCQRRGSVTWHDQCRRITCVIKIMITRNHCGRGCRVVLSFFPFLFFQNATNFLFRAVKSWGWGYYFNEDVIDITVLKGDIWCIQQDIMLTLSIPTVHHGLQINWFTMCDQIRLHCFPVQIWQFLLIQRGVNFHSHMKEWWYFNSRVGISSQVFSLGHERSFLTKTFSVWCNQGGGSEGSYHVHDGRRDQLFVRCTKRCYRTAEPPYPVGLSVTFRGGGGLSPGGGGLVTGKGAKSQSHTEMLPLWATDSCTQVSSRSL